MNREEALEFLQSHQPMPPDTDLSEELITRYDEVRHFFIRYPDEKAIPLFLKSFGEGDGFGVYQLVEDVLRHFHPEEVILHLKQALSDQHRAVRYWCARIAAIFPNGELIDPLSKLLLEDDQDMKSSAAIAIAQIEDPKASKLLRDTLNREIDPYIISVIQDLLAEP